MNVVLGVRVKVVRVVVADLALALGVDLLNHGAVEHTTESGNLSLELLDLGRGLGLGRLLIVGPVLVKLKLEERVVGEDGLEERIVAELRVVLGDSSSVGGGRFVAADPVDQAHATVEVEIELGRHSSEVEAFGGIGGKRLLRGRVDGVLEERLGAESVAERRVPIGAASIVGGRVRARVGGRRDVRGDREGHGDRVCSADVQLRPGILDFLDDRRVSQNNLGPDVRHVILACVTGWAEQGPFQTRRVSPCTKAITFGGGCSATLRNHGRHRVSSRFHG